MACDPDLMALLARFAKESPANARMARANPRRFVAMVIGGRAEWIRLAAHIDFDGIAATDWATTWIQPTSEP